MTTHIPIDFVPGSHGNYLETVLNREFVGLCTKNNFTNIGTSHVKSSEYQENKLFYADHWSEDRPTELSTYSTIISIQFSQDDLLLLSSVSLYRSGDANIDNNELEHNTVTKLLNSYYKHVVHAIKQAYPFVDLSADSIPRYVLREYFKFGFKNPDINGHWLKKQQMIYQPWQTVINFNFSSFYNVDTFVEDLATVATRLGFTFEPTDEFYQMHQKFLSFNPYINHKQQCDTIVNAVVNRVHCAIPKLSLFQESYINGRLENIFNKEMPFRQSEYCSSTEELLYYLEYLAPEL